jgi:hypothetical protein
MSAVPESRIGNLVLNIPSLWDRDWQGAIDKTTGADRDLVIIECRAANLLKLINDHSVTFDRLAWLSIWTKCFSIIEGARAAVNQGSQYLLELLKRTSFELLLHTLTVLEADPVIRLRAYAAWCLWNDRIFQKELLDPGTLDSIWNPKPAEDIMNDPVARELHERLFGPLTVETDHDKLRTGRFLQRNDEQFRLHRIESWLNDPELRTWHDRLKNLAGRDGKRQVAFFTLFNDSEKAVARRVHSLGMGFAYLQYRKGSMFVHGSTLEHAFAMQEQTLTPGIDDSVETDAELVGSQCNTVLVLLAFVQSELWSKSSPSLE